MKPTLVLFTVAAFLCLSFYHASALATCATTNCGSSSCCDTTNHGAQCYDSTMYACNPEVLCPIQTPLGCGIACYSASQYTCVSGNLQQIPQGSTPTPSAPTQAPPSTTRAPSTQTPTTTHAPSTPTPTTTRASTTQAPTTAAPITTRAPTTQSPSTQTPTGPTPLNGFCASRTDCANIGQQCCETTHPATGVTESECYDPTKFRCNAKVMCPIDLQACEFSCYSDQYLQCVNGQLVPKQRK